MGLASRSLDLSAADVVRFLSELKYAPRERAINGSATTKQPLALAQCMSNTDPIRGLNRRS